MERMDSFERSSTTSVVKRLFAQPYEFSFLQAVRLFQKLLPNGSLVGTTLTPSEDPITFSSRYTYSLPSSDIYRIHVPDGKLVIEVNFWNIAGPHGALPAPLSEKVNERMREGDFALKEFLDIFNHRLLSIYYCVAQKYSFVLSPKNSIQTTVGQMMCAVAGVDPDREGYASVPTAALARYSGIIWQRPRSAAGLEQILSDYFQVPVHIDQFVGSWVDINRRQRSFMGIKRGRNHKLGRTTFLGKRFWQSNHHFIVNIGPLTSKQFHLFIPTGAAYGEMCDMIKFYAPLELTFQLKMSLKEGEKLVPLGFDNPSKENRLGWTSVLTKAPVDYTISINAA
ncbi:MAG: type VI secretion system baseplate subunit TssG [Alphaproteobacteria bacterium]|nr:type VI secretion system baseplate subunit TssG [Alphaproteobacteria bacterium]